MEFIIHLIRCWAEIDGGLLAYEILTQYLLYLHNSITGGYF